MKKIYTFIAAMLACVTLNSCMTMGGGNGMMGGNGMTGTAATAGNMQNASSLIGNLISTFASGVMTNQSSIVGTWKYQKPSVQFESESLLSKAGGSMAATAIENKLEPYFQKIGLTSGKAQFTFVQDGSLQYTIGSRTMTGKYVFNSANRTVTITTQTGANITAYVSVSLNQMALTFDASKLLTLVNSASAASSSLSSLTALTGTFNGMKIGFTFSR